MGKEEIDGRIRKRRSPEIRGEYGHERTTEARQPGEFEYGWLWRQSRNYGQPQREIAQLKGKAFGKTKSLGVESPRVPDDFIHCQEAAEKRGDLPAAGRVTARQTRQQCGHAGMDASIARCAVPKSRKPEDILFVRLTANCQGQSEGRPIESKYGRTSAR